MELKALRILYAEDDEQIRELITRTLKREVGEVYQAKDGVEALELFKTHKPDLVITDIDMPRMDGFELSKEIRALNRDTPIIATTASNETQRLVLAIEIGFTSYLIKPINISKLILVIKDASRIVLLEKDRKNKAEFLEQYKKIVDASSMFIRLDKDGIIKYANEQFCDVVGYSEKETVGASYKILQDKDSLDDEFENIWQSVNQNKTWQGVLKIKDSYDLTLWLNATFTPIVGDNNDNNGCMALFSNITDIKYKQHELEHEKRITAIILDMQHSMTAFATNNFGILKANKALLDFTGYSNIGGFHKRYSCVGDLFMNEAGYIGALDAISLEDIYNRSEAGERLRVKMQDKNGLVSIFDLKVKRAFIEDYDYLSNHDFFLITLHNITEFENAVMAAKEAERSKSEFLANMSHEIRTPMNGIIGFANLLEKSALSKEQADYVKIISQSADHLLGIINDVLDFSKIESGKFTLESIEFNPTDEIETTIELFGAKALEKNITLSSFIDPKLPILLGDPMRLKQVLYNFLSNALKFTPSNGRVTITVKQISQENGHCVTRFAVKDSGVGIAKEKLIEIFNPFSQADPSVSRKFGGTGLGLAICDKIIKLMGSQIEVESETNKGSEFTFEIETPIVGLALQARAQNQNILILNYERLSASFLCDYLDSFGYKWIAGDIRDIDLADIIFFDCIDTKDLLILSYKFSAKKFICITNKFEYRYAIEASIIAVQAPIHASKLLDAILDERHGHETLREIKTALAPQFKQKCALIAEDNKINQKLIAILLNARGIETVTANDGLEALKLYNDRHYDIIFMDIHMPNLDGLGALRGLQAIWESGVYAQTPIVALTANALKGDKERFLEAGFLDYIAKPIDAKELDRILYKFLDASALIAQKQDSKKDINMEKLVDIQELEENLGLDLDTILMLLQDFKEDVVGDLDGLLKAIEQNDFEEIKSWAHKIKGACGNLRIKPGASTALEIEQNAINKNENFNYMDSFNHLNTIIEAVSLQV